MTVLGFDSLSGGDVKGFQVVLGFHFVGEYFLELLPPYSCMPCLPRAVVFSLRVSLVVIILIKGCCPQF